MAERSLVAAREKGPSRDKGSILEQIGTDYTLLAREGRLDPVIGRQHEMEKVVDILSRRRKNNPALVGEPGVGKTAIVEGLAQRIVTGQVPPSLQNMRLIEIDLGAMVAGTELRGQFEERMKRLLDEVKGQSIILVIDEMHTIVGAGAGQGAQDASNLLKPALARGQVRMIGATTIDEYRQYVERDAALARRFNRVDVPQPSLDETLQILQGVRERYEEHHQVRISDEGLEAAVMLSERYIPARFHPDKDIDLIDTAAAHVRASRYRTPGMIEDLQARISVIETHLAVLGDDDSRRAQRKRQALEDELESVSAKLVLTQDRWKEQSQLVTILEEKAPQTQDQLQAALAISLQPGEQLNYIQAAGLLYLEAPALLGEINRLETAWQSIPVEERLIQREVNREAVAQQVARWTGIPVTSLRRSEAEKLLTLEEELGRRIKGQNRAVTEVAEAVRRQRSGLADPSRPVSLILCGSTGIGKTELAKAVTETLFADKIAMTRLNGSEYGSYDAVAKLIGVGPGLVGSDQAGILTGPVRLRPYQTVLFDEIEKAHPETHALLLQVLDEGQITDGSGRNVDFRNTVFIATTNVGAAIKLPSGVDDEQYKEAVSETTEQLSRVMRPEVVNRFGAVVLLNQLDLSVIAEIAEMQVEEVVRRADEQGFDLVVTESAVRQLAQEGFSPEFGARPLRRTIDRYLIDPLGTSLIGGEITVGDEIVVDCSPDEGFTFVKTFENEASGIQQNREDQIKVPIPHS